MASTVSFTLSASPPFQAGTVVNCYLRRSIAGPPPVSGQVPGGAPVATSATVASTGRLTFEGLEPETQYFAGAQVNGTWEWKGFTTNSAAAAAAATSGLQMLTGQNTAVGEGAFEKLALEPTVDLGVHTSNTAFGWHAGKNLTGLVGTFAPTGETAPGSSVIAMTGVEGKAGPAWGGGTSNTPMVVFRSLTPGVTGIQTGIAYYVVGGTANSFEVSLTHGGAAVKVGGVALKTDTQVAFLASAEDNTLIGSQAGVQLTTGGGNTLVGENAGVNLTTGEENTFIGCETGQGSLTGGSCVAVGFRAAMLATVGGLVALGTSALELATTGIENTAVGHKAMQKATTGKQNTALGFAALTALTTGNTNTAVGDQAGKALTTGAENTMVGHIAGQALTTGNENTLVGKLAGAALTTTSKNTAVGQEAMGTSTAGERNVVLGYSAGENVSGNKNVLLGHKAGQTAGAISNRLIVANDATAAATLIEGDFSAQTLGFYGVTPVAKAAAIASPAETLAALKTAVDALRVAVKGIGITA